MEIGGQDVEHNFITAALELQPRQRMLVEKGFHSLAYIRAHSKPEARIGIHSPRHGKPYLIPPHAWGNMWVYGMDIFLTGWLTHEDFRRKASLLTAGAHTFQDRQHTFEELAGSCQRTKSPWEDCSKRYSFGRWKKPRPNSSS